MKEQQEFLDSAKTFLYEDQIREVQGASPMLRVAEKKLTRNCLSGFSAIAHCKTKKKLGAFQTKSALLGMFDSIGKLIIKKKDFSFQKLVKMDQQLLGYLRSNPKLKKKMWTLIKKQRRRVLSKLLWKWYLAPTPSERKLFEHAADSLTLQTTKISREVALYRLLHKIKKQKAKISPGVDKMNIFINKYLKECFDRIKTNGKEVVDGLRTRAKIQKLLLLC